MKPMLVTVNMPQSRLSIEGHLLKISNWVRWVLTRQASRKWRIILQKLDQSKTLMGLRTNSRKRIKKPL